MTKQRKAILPLAMVSVLAIGVTCHLLGGRQSEIPVRKPLSIEPGRSPASDSAESDPKWCPDPQAPARARAQYSVHYPAETPRIRAAVFGTTLQGTEEEFRHARDILQDFPGVEMIDPLKECATVACFLARAFRSEESAHLALAIAARNGVIVSLSQRRNPKGQTQVWAPEEIRLIDEVLAKLPDPIRRIPTLRYFYRMHDSIRRFRGETVAGLASPDPSESKGISGHADAPQAFRGVRPGRGSIRLYRRAFMDGPEFALFTIGHEIGHHLDFSGAYRNGEWDRLSMTTGIAEVNWRWTWRFWKGIEPRPGAVFVRPQGKRSQSEDFADLIAAYLSVPGKLRQTDSKRYELVRDRIFSGLEFRDPLIPYCPDAASAVTSASEAERPAE